MHTTDTPSQPLRPNCADWRAECREIDLTEPYGWYQNLDRDAQSANHTGAGDGGDGRGHETQLIFLDVPGVFDATQTFEKAMVNAAWASARAADVIVFMHDARKVPREESEIAIRRIARIWAKTGDYRAE